MPLLQTPEKFIYHRDEVYEGAASPTKINIIKVGDAVIDWNEGIMRCMSVDVNFVPTLQIWNPIENVDIDNDETSLITGLSGYQPSIISRAFYSINLGIKRITLDSAYRIFGTDPTKCKIFLGTNTTPTGTIISSPETINLVAINSPLTTQKVVPISEISMVLTEGMLITIVIYTDSGSRVGEKTFVVKESAAMAPLNTTKKVVSGVSLDGSPWLSNIIPDQLEIPANYGMQIGTTNATVTYSNGYPNATVPIDGVSCKLLGMDNFNNNLAGITSYLTLVYTPDFDNDEICENGNLNNQVTRTYQVITTTDDMDVEFKLYLSIYYNPITQMYGFRVYLSNFDYDELILLNPSWYTIRDQNGDPINLSRSWHVNNGVVNVVIRADMSLIFPLLFNQYFFVQQMELDLNDVTIYSHSWYLDYDPTHTLKLDGIYKFHTNQSNNYEDLDIRGGAGNVGEWIDRYFDPLFPITGVVSPVPTHFRIRYFDTNNTTIIYESADIPIGDYNVSLNTPGNIWRDKSTVEIFWLIDHPGFPKYEVGVTPVVINAIYA